MHTPSQGPALKIHAPRHQQLALSPCCICAGCMQAIAHQCAYRLNQVFLPHEAAIRLPACKRHPPGVPASGESVVNRPSAWQGLCSLTPRAAAAARKALCSSRLGPLLRKPRWTCTQHLLSVYGLLHLLWVAEVMYVAVITTSSHHSSDVM